MRAIILAFDRSGMEGSTRLAPPFLLPLVDRPFLQHVIERLVDAGITEFDMVLDERTRGLPAYFGKGQRWGSSIEYHLPKYSNNPLAYLTTLIDPTHDEPILLATADALHDFRQEDLSRLSEPGHPVHFACQETASTRNWAGWALVNGEFLASLPAKGDLETLADHLQRSGEADPVSNVLYAGTYAELLQAQQCVVKDQIARRAWVHPSVSLHGPVTIGANARIERGAVLGPNVVIGEGCVIGAGTCIQHSLICPKTYVGDGLDIRHSILEGEELFHTVLSASVTIREPIFLSRVSR